MPQQTNDSISTVLSKLAVVIPLIIIIAALFIEFYAPPETKQLGSQAKKPVVTVTVAVTSTPAVKRIAFDLKGPLICDAVVKDSSVSARIKDKKIALLIQQPKKVENMVVKDDCLYRWTKGVASGAKTCGMNEQLSVLEFLSALGGKMFDAKLIMNVVAQMGINTSLNQEELSKVDPDCRKTALDDAVFVIPKNVSFKEVKPTVTPTVKR